MAESPINRSAKTVISRTLLLDDTIIYLFIYLFVYLFIYFYYIYMYMYINVVKNVIL